MRFRIRRRQRRGVRLLVANAFALWAALALNPCFVASADMNMPTQPFAAAQADMPAMPDCPYAAAPIAPDCDVLANLDCELPEPFAAQLSALDAAPVFIPVVLHTLAPAASATAGRYVAISDNPPTPLNPVSAHLRHCVFLI